MGSGLSGKYGPQVGEHNDSTTSSSGNGTHDVNAEDADKVRLPPNDSQLKHIFRKEGNHLEYTESNMQKTIELANDRNYYCGRDSRGIDWNAKDLGDGRQFWVSYRNGVIQDAGINITPRLWNDRTGFNMDAYTYRGPYGE